MFIELGLKEITKFVMLLFIPVLSHSNDRMSASFFSFSLPSLYFFDWRAETVVIFLLNRSLTLLKPSSIYFSVFSNLAFILFSSFTIRQFISLSAASRQAAALLRMLSISLLILPTFYFFLFPCFRLLARSTDVNWIRIFLLYVICVFKSILQMNGEIIHFTIEVIIFMLAILGRAKYLCS